MHVQITLPYTTGDPRYALDFVGAELVVDHRPYHVVALHGGGKGKAKTRDPEEGAKV